ncbi:Mediator of DNA damage checkpoint protein 1 [Bienertia sinuspersici]
MATLPFRPPQFSDDVAWLPAWLQPNQSTLTSHDIANNELFQNVDSHKGESSQVKEPCLLTNRENNYNICHLYLSGDESSPVTLTPSYEKVLHFNLHLSTDVTSSIISNPLLHTQDDKLSSASAISDTREKIQSSTGHDSSKLNFVPSTSSDHYSRQFAKQPPLSNNDVGQNTLETLDSKCAECDDIIGAVELSVAASEALVIHRVVQSGSLYEAMSASAILEVALRVKQARLDELKDSSCCCKDSGNTVDILSDLGESDMEDAYKDVGLTASVSDNNLLKDPSTSLVKETPMSEIPLEDGEVQCKWQVDHEVFSNNCIATELQDRNLETIKSKVLPVEISDNMKIEKMCRNPPPDLIFAKQSQRNLDALQPLQEEKNDMSYSDGFYHQLELQSPIQPQHSKTARLDSKSIMQDSYHVDINEVNNRSSCGFQSRWFGGWTGMVSEGDACGGMKSKERKPVPNFFVCETSYLSESMDVFPDQSSVANNHRLSSNAPEAGKPVEDLYETATERAFVSQEVVKDSTAFNDPLCSMVPCSISAETGDQLTPTNDNNAHQVLDAFKKLPTGKEISVEIAQTSYGHPDIGRGKHGELDINDVDPCSLNHRQLTSLKTYSAGLPGNSVFDSRLVSLGEKDAKLPSESTKFPNDKNTTKKPLVKSMSNCATYKCNQEDQEMKQLSTEQNFSCTKNSEDGKQPPITSTFSCTTATDSKENHIKNVCGRLNQDGFEKNDEKGEGQQVHLENIPSSPLVLSQRSRRFKAPKLCVSNVSTANLLEDQAPASNETCHKISSSPQDQFRNLPKGDVPTRKRVRFSDFDSKLQDPQGQLKNNLRGSSCRVRDRLQNCDQEQGASQEVKERLTKCRIKSRKRTIFQGLDFLLTGFSKKKEKDIEGLLRKHGGTVLADIPAPLPHPRRRSSRFNAQRLPVILCSKKLQTTRFLFGCAANAFLLKVGWAYDSIKAGSVLPPDKYLILSNQKHRMLNQIGKSICQNDNDYIFDRVGHGRGHVHKSLQWLVQSLEKKKISLAVIVAEDENRATRHLTKCASEQKIAVVPEKWIINSLIEGKLLPLPDRNCRLSNPRENSIAEISVLQDWSQEI